MDNCIRCGNSLDYEEQERRICNGCVDDAIENLAQDEKGQEWVIEWERDEKRPHEEEG